MALKSIFLCFLIAVITFVACVDNLKDPYDNPENAQIEPATSLSNLAGVLKAGTVFSCSVNVYLPKLIDSLIVRISHGGFDSIFYRTVVGDSSLVVFSFSSQDTGRYALQVIVVKSDGMKDSLPVPKQFTIVDYAPGISPIATSYKAYLGDSVSVRFHVSSRDSALYGYSTFFTFDSDTSKSHNIDVIYPLSSHKSSDTITRVLKGKILLEGLKNPMICYAQTFDRSNASSAVASCSIYVVDTVRPKVRLLAPHAALRDSITTLPDSIYVHFFDSWGVDSVTLNGAKMAFISDTVAKQTVSSLSQGVNYETIIAWDKARNTDTIFLTLAYGGPQPYPPEIKNLDKSVLEGKSFDTLFLDTLAIATDPAITNNSLDSAYRASLLWIISDNVGNLASTYNANSRKFFVPVQNDSEWTDTLHYNFKVIDPKGHLNERVGTFMINEVPDPPVMNVKSIQPKLAGVPFDTLFLDTCAKDPDDSSRTLNWSFKNGKFFKIDSIRTLLKLPKSEEQSSGLLGSTPRFARFTRKVAIVPIDTVAINWSTWTGIDTLIFTVRDPGNLYQRKPIVFEKHTLLHPVVIDTMLLKPIFTRLSSHTDRTRRQ